jgi:hypothetical protein
MERWEVTYMKRSKSNISVTWHNFSCVSGFSATSCQPDDLTMSSRNHWQNEHCSAAAWRMSAKEKSNSYLGESLTGLLSKSLWQWLHECGFWTIGGMVVVPCYSSSSSRDGRWVWGKGWCVYWSRSKDVSACYVYRLRKRAPRDSQGRVYRIMKCETIMPTVLTGDAIWLWSRKALLKAVCPILKHKFKRLISLENRPGQISCQRPRTVRLRSCEIVSCGGLEDTFHLCVPHQITFPLPIFKQGSSRHRCFFLPPCVRFLAKV